jgi:hypothetical protein
MIGNDQVRFGPEVAGKGPAQQAPRQRPTGTDPHQPRPAHAPDLATVPDQRRPRRDSTSWTHPALTGVTPGQWDQLTDALAISHRAYTEAALHVHRGGPSWRKPAGGHPPALTVPEMLLVATLRTRFQLPRRVLAELFATSTNTITKAEKQITPLLDLHKHTIKPAETTYTTLAELTTFAAANGVTLTPGTKPAR